MGEADRGRLSLWEVAHAIRRNVLAVVLVTLAGAAAGFFLSTASPSYRATVILEVAPGGDVGETSVLVQSAASTMTSPVVIEQSARNLGTTPAGLIVTADVEAGTNLIDLTAVADSPDAAVQAATEVVDVALADYRARSQARATEVRKAGADLLANGGLEEPRAEAARQQSIGSVVGSVQGQAVQGTVSVSVASPALNATPTGVSRPVGTLLGAAAGALFTCLLVLSRTWNRRRTIKTNSDFEYAARYANVGIETAERAAGTALNSKKSYVVVVGHDVAARETLARTIATTISANATATALLSVIPGESGLQQVEDGGWEIGDDHIREALSRAARDELPERLGVEVVVGCIPANPSVTVYLAGQDDYLAFVAVPTGTAIGRAEEQLSDMSVIDPIGVLQS